MDITQERIRIEWLILADGAQVSGQKLFLLGGGWDTLTVNSGFPFPQHLGLAVAFRVPWNATNQKHVFEVSILDDDTSETLASVGGEFETGRPPGVPPGISQLAQLAAEMTLEFKGPGLFVVRASINGEEQTDRQFPFRVIEGPGIRLTPQHRARPD